MLSYIFVVVGFALMMGGADFFVRGAVRGAAALKISSLIVGLTIVAWGTSLPELAVSIGATGKDAAGIALGNVIGSNIANVLLIGGVAAMMLPLACPAGDLRRDAIFLAIASVLATGLGALGVLTVWMGLLLLGLLLLQTFTIYRAVHSGQDVDVEMPDEDDAQLALWKAGVFLLGGLVAVIAGSELLVRSAITVAGLWDVPDAIIGVTIVAIGTSLPELATSLAAARQGERDVIIGNIVGSNIANIVLVLGAVAVIAPGTIPAELLDGDGWVMIATSAVFVGLLMLGRTVGWLWGLAFLAAYAVYLGWQFQFFGLVG